mmetsp:Transcript_117627/g.333372  ORF Transcript_117627/g.333372 Transcript_117627/m.333372 type:complete len:290 (+) Transcript_117627:371-1240(+)
MAACAPTSADRRPWYQNESRPMPTGAQAPWSHQVDANCSAGTPQKASRPRVPDPPHEHPGDGGCGAASLDPAPLSRCPGSSEQFGPSRESSYASKKSPGSPRPGSPTLSPGLRKGVRVVVVSVRFGSSVVSVTVWVKAGSVVVVAVVVFVTTVDTVVSVVVFAVVRLSASAVSAAANAASVLVSGATAVPVAVCSSAAVVWAAAAAVVVAVLARTATAAASGRVLALLAGHGSTSMASTTSTTAPRTKPPSWRGQALAYRRACAQRQRQRPIVLFLPVGDCGGLAGLDG